MQSKYKLFVNGKLINTCNTYDMIYNRALGIVMYLDMKDSFTNLRGKGIIDKWSDGKNLIIIEKITE